MWQNTAEGNRGANQGVEFLVASDGKLQMPRGDALDLEILGGVSSEFEDFRSQVFEHSGDVDGSCRQSEFKFCGDMEGSHTFGTNSHLVLSVVLEETLDSPARELLEGICQLAACNARYNRRR